MRFFILAAVLGLAAPALSYSNNYTVRYDPKYDNKETPLNTFACAYGDHGLIPHGYKKLGDVPSFPILGAAPQIDLNQEMYCNSCWELTFHDERIGNIRVNFTAIDCPGAGSEGDFTISLEGMEHLTHDQGHKSVWVTATQKPRKWCLLDEE